MCEIRFPGRLTEFKFQHSIYKTKIYGQTLEAVQESHAHCLTEWNCPWGSRGNYKAAHKGEVKGQQTVGFRVDDVQQALTFIWACSPEYSTDWKMCQVYLRLISVRATYWRYHRWIRTAAFIAGRRYRWSQHGHKHECTVEADYWWSTAYTSFQVLDIFLRLSLSGIL